MIAVRCTSKLLQRLAIKPDLRPVPSTTILGDWYASLLHTRRGQYVLAMARNSLLPIVVSGRDIRSFPARVAVTLRDVLTSYGVSTDAVERECAGMSEWSYARTDHRSNVGVLTDLMRLLDAYLEDSTLTLTALSLRLAYTPIVARNLFPDAETCRLFGVPPPRPRR